MHKQIGAILLVAGTCIGSGMIALPMVLAETWTDTQHTAHGGHVVYYVPQLIDQFRTQSASGARACLGRTGTLLF